ncbi:hypothetical protein M5689_010207 [Euphorbia peplus]|nr:hypothetical protein M5689_010207 [Euphorbia peplus]
MSEVQAQETQAQVTEQVINVDSQPQAAEAKLKRKRKPMKPRAKVWGHFTKFTDEECNIKGKCNYCEKDFHCDPYKNGNTAMNTHMRACRKNPHSIQTRQTQLALQPMMTLGNGETDVGCLSTWKFDQQACRESLAVMIIIDELPFKFVENEGYRKHMAIAQPRFKIPSRTTVARDVYQLYLNEKTRLREYFVLEIEDLRRS